MNDRERQSSCSFVHKMSGTDFFHWKRLYRKQTGLCILVVVMACFIVLTLRNQLPIELKHKLSLIDLGRWAANGSRSSQLISHKNTSPQPSPSLSSSTAATSNKLQVLLITYARSGSSFTSALISHHSDVLFSFEPLHPLHANKTNALKTPPKIHPSLTEAINKTLNGTHDRLMFSASMSIIESYLTCNFAPSDVFALLNLHMNRDEHSRTLKKCLMSLVPGTSHVTCFLRFLESCHNHRIVFVKTIRFRMEWAQWFLEHYPHVKVLYLMRDPRATLFSQDSAFNITQSKNISTAAREHCSDVERDLRAAEHLQKIYPRRLKGIRYEKGAMDPFDFTKDIYNFLGLDYTKDVEKFVKYITGSKGNNTKVDKTFSVIRSNSTKTMNRWRHCANFADVQVIDHVCSYLYPKLGYKSVASKEDLVSESSLTFTPELDGVF